MIIRGREQKCFSNFAELNISAESVAQSGLWWIHTLLFLSSTSKGRGEGWGWQGGYNPPRLPHLLAFFRLRNISIVACCVIFSYSSRFSSFQNPTSRPLSSCIPKPSRPYSLFPRPLTPVLPPPPPPPTTRSNHLWKRWAKAISIILSKVLGAAFDQ